MNEHTYAMGPKAAIRFELKKIAFYGAVFAVVFTYNYFTGVYR
jgi:hypothetical protein